VLASSIREQAIPPIFWIVMGRRTKSEIATYFAGLFNQANSCVAVMEGLRALRRKPFGRGKRRGNLTTKKFPSSQALLVATGL
jgi:hypothetical protein